MIYLKSEPFIIHLIRKMWMGIYLHGDAVGESEIPELWPFTIRGKILTVHRVENFCHRKLLTVRLDTHLWIRYLFTYLRLGFGWTIWSVEKIWIARSGPSRSQEGNWVWWKLVQRRLLLLCFGRSYGAGNGLLLLCRFEIICMEIELGISLICFFQKL